MEQIKQKKENFNCLTKMPKDGGGGGGGGINCLEVTEYPLFLSDWLPRIFYRIVDFYTILFVMQHVSSDPLIFGNLGFNFLIL